MADKYFGKRAMLNKPGHESTAAIVAEIKDTSKDPIREEAASWIPEPTYTLQISDCSRSVSFDLDFGTKSGRKNNFFKVRKMIEVLQAFEAGLMVETRRHEENLKRAGLPLD